MQFINKRGNVVRIREWKWPLPPVSDTAIVNILHRWEIVEDIYEVLVHMQSSRSRVFATLAEAEAELAKRAKRNGWQQVEEVES